MGYPSPELALPGCNGPVGEVLFPMPANEEARLEALRNLHILDTLTDDRFDRITRLAKARFGKRVVRISFVDRDRTWFKSRIGINAQQAPRSIAVCAHAIMASTPLVVADMRSDPRFANSPQVIGGPKFRFYAGAPIRIDGQFNVGSLCLMDTEPDADFGPEDAAFLTDLAEIVVHELELHRQVAETQVALSASRKSEEVAKAAKQKFLSIVSHELRTPLHLIQGFNQLIAQQAFGPINDDRYADYAAEALSAAQHLNTLIDRVLNYAAAEAGELTLSETVFPITDLFDALYRAMRSEIVNTGVDIVVAMEPDAPKNIRADYLRMQEILQQLCRNAMAASPAGSTVLCRASRAVTGDICLCIADEGDGIPASVLSQLPNCFVQGEDPLTRHHEGLGLGLSTARSLANLHGGSLAFRDRDDRRGTITTVTLPAYRIVGE